MTVCCCCYVTSVMSSSVQPRRRQPTRLPRPWDSPGKNTGVGCYFLLQCMKVKSESEVAQLCPTLRPHGLQPTRLLCLWDFPGKSTGVGCHTLLPCDTAIMLLGIYPKGLKTYIHTKPCSLMFIANLFIIVSNQDVFQQVNK